MNNIKIMLLVAPLEAALNCIDMEKESTPIIMEYLMKECALLVKILFLTNWSMNATLTTYSKNSNTQTQMTTKKWDSISCVQIQTHQQCTRWQTRQSGCWTNSIHTLLKNTDINGIILTHNSSYCFSINIIASRILAFFMLTINLLNLVSRHWLPQERCGYSD